MSVRVDINTRAVDRELDRLGSAPDMRLHFELEGILSQQFLETQAAVHVDTFSLHSSGDIDSHVGEHQWTGIISYGGPSAGSFYDPVDYAWYEQRRDGAHDFMLPVRVTEDEYLAVILDFLDGH